MNDKKFTGAFAAAVTPLLEDFSPDYDAIPPFIKFPANQGCHGTLILGTTGEGPSFSFSERSKIFKAATEIRKTHPNFILYAGTGTPSMQETIELNKTVFDLGFDGVVVLPPYYFRKANDNGLFAWFYEVIKHSVPKGRLLLGYHIPAFSGVPLTMELLKRLKDAFPDRFGGIKDSSGDQKRIVEFESIFGSDLLYYVGNDRLFLKALNHQGAGMITALSNVTGKLARAIWEKHQSNDPHLDLEDRLNNARSILEKHPFFAPTIKAILHRLYKFPFWSVRPPLENLNQENIEKVVENISKYLLDGF
jgi:4-hydroxy-tetrahydrodipicolinate synthase